MSEAVKLAGRPSRGQMSLLPAYSYLLPMHLFVKRKKIYGNVSPQATSTVNKVLFFASVLLLFLLSSKSGATSIDSVRSLIDAGELEKASKQCSSGIDAWISDDNETPGGYMGYIRLWGEIFELRPDLVSDAKHWANDSCKRLNKTENLSKSFKVICLVNYKLDSDDKTAACFHRIAKISPESARMIYGHAERSLILQGEYKICAEYLDPDTRFKYYTGMYEYLSNNQLPGHNKDFPQEQYSMLICYMVCILKNTSQDAAAKELSIKALDVLGDSEYSAQIKNSAATGDLPDIDIYKDHYGHERW